MPGVYKHKVYFRPDIEDIVNKCQQSAPYKRPTAQSLVKALETLLLRVITKELEKQRVLQQKKLDSVLAEVFDLEKKLKDVSTMVSKGVELISKREVMIFSQRGYL
jgi:hypothetical protein